MKPSWDDAPEWAKYLAMDGDEAWYWFQDQPNLIDDTWIRSVVNGRYIQAAAVPVHYADTLEARPEAK